MITANPERKTETYLRAKWAQLQAQSPKSKRKGVRPLMPNPLTC